MKGCRVFSNKYGIKTYMTSLTCSGGLRANLLPERKTLFSTGCAFELCGMRIEAFTVPHDVDTVGFVFRVGDRKLGVATDLGHLNMLARQKLHDCAVLVVRFSSSAGSSDGTGISATTTLLILFPSF